ncbi:MAG: hypothetical protein GKR98_06935 [Boseongicola sp.]|nr:MAG: hypothetical protein GKR98_06935 [Boseongicola sp.]
MPKMNITNSEIARAKLGDRQTWFTDGAPKTGHNRYPGLRLCISKTAKTFYVVKWNPNTETTEQHKLGRHAPNFTLPMAWDAALTKAHEIEQPPKPEPETEELPTLREALEEYVTYRLTLNPKVGNRMDGWRYTLVPASNIGAAWFLAWNMPYHAEHHAYPQVPFYKLPELHELTAEHLAVTEAGYRRFMRGYVAGLVVRRSVEWVWGCRIVRRLVLRMLGR